MKKLFAPLLVLLTALLFSGCSSNIVATTAGLHADLVKINRATNGDIQVTWRVRNPNVVSYVLTRHSLKISVDGTAIGTIAAEKRFGIPPMNQADHTSVLTVSDPAANQAITQALAKGSANYTLNATLWLLLRDDEVEKFTLNNSDTVPVTAE